MKLLDRYVLRNFLQPYVYCIVGFISIWLIYDISDNVSVFIDQNFGFRRTVHYYFTQLPQIGVILLPISLLLALLYSLGRMSRANEIVSMLTAGLSIPRIIFPLIFVGLLTVWATYGLNYELAPHSESARRNLLMSERVRRELRIEGQIFRNRTDNRTWFVQSFRKGENDFRNVQVLQQNEHDKIITNYIALAAKFDPQAKTWELLGVKVVRYDDQGNITKEEMHGSLVINNWSETPYRLGSANVRAENLSVPELRDYLKYNADFPQTLLAPFQTHLQYRMALPWTCMVVVLIAAPLGIGYSRRGILSSVAASIILVFAMQVLTHLFVALGEGDRVPAWIAGWMPNLIFTVVGAYLLFLRATNREGLGIPFLGLLSRK